MGGGLAHTTEVIFDCTVVIYVYPRFVVAGELVAPGRERFEGWAIELLVRRDARVGQKRPRTQVGHYYTHISSTRQIEIGARVLIADRAYIADNRPERGLALTHDRTARRA
jgi:hypothetical protein